MSGPDISWIDETGLEASWFPQLEHVVVTALAHEGAAPASSLRILLTDDATLRRLNCDYLGLDEPTDVLSFGSGLDPARPGDLGDVAISVPRAARQAEAAGHGLLAELKLLLVHATLHLLGHDHGTPHQKATMWQAQAEILEAVAAAVQLPG